MFSLMTAWICQRKFPVRPRVKESDAARQREKSAKPKGVFLSDTTLCVNNRRLPQATPRTDRTLQDESSVLNLSFKIASLGLLTPRCNQSRTFVTGSVCVTELRTSTSNWVIPPGSISCLRNAHNPKTDASYNPSAATSTEWRMPSKSTNDTIQAAMRRRIAFSEIFANRTMCHLWDAETELDFSSPHR